MHSARHLDSAQHEVASSLRRRGREVWPLLRRDADLGHVVSVHRELGTSDLQQAAFDRCDPIFLPGVLGSAPQRHAAQIQTSLQMFDRLRAGGEFLDELEQRLHDDDALRYAGSTIDTEDPRCIERVFVNAESNGEVIAEDLWAMLAWITAVEDDPTLRIRFSNGLDQLESWMTTGDHAASWVDQFALRAFPECDAMLSCAALRQRLDQWLRRDHRLSERIVYNNAPNGGAVFHHDAEPGQLGVVFGQLEGRTAWFSMSKHRLATVLAKVGYRDRHRAMQALDDASDPALIELLNRDDHFARQLAAHGGLFLLRAGDAIVLPSQGIDDVAWHSVLAIGDRPSLAHSYGIFPRGPDYELAGDPWLASK